MNHKLKEKVRCPESLSSFACVADLSEESASLETVRATEQEFPQTDFTPAEVTENKLTVLVADDDDMIRILAAQTLESQGFEVIVAEDGKVALDMFTRSRPDLVLCDVMMPNVDGFEFCATVRETLNEKHTPIIMLTGLNDLASIEKGFSVGATDFSIKPITWALLPHRVRYVLRASRALQDLRASEERYSLAARGANDGLWDWDLSRDVIYYSPRWMGILGFAENEISASPQEWLSRIHDEDSLRVRSDLAAYQEGKTGLFECEYRTLCSDGSFRWVMCRGLAVRDKNGMAYRMTGSMSDITKRKEAEARLLFDAFHDSLTKLPNRALFLDRLSHSMKLLSRRKSYKFAVFFLDLDRFKMINDSLGHLMGDLLLKEVAKRIASVLRAGDTLARLGGDEFVIICEDISNEAVVTQLADRIQDEIAVPILLDGQRVVTAVSIGIAISNDKYIKPEEMLRDADAAMYKSKKSSITQYQIFDERMHQQVKQFIEMESDLRTALNEKQFVVHYQPIVELGNDCIRGFEALVRWQHPQRGLLLPDDFIQVAVETRLIVMLGRWVLRQACEQIKEWKQNWKETESWYVSVNLSSPELAQPDLVSVIQDLLYKTGLSPQSLKLEITESTIIENSSHALDTMNTLRGMGINLSIDDFGTGYSSFNYLRQFPFDALKIDRSFIQDMDQNADHFEIVKTIITLAHNMGMDVVAEGGEEIKTIEALKNLPCEFAQGYCFTEPKCAQEISKYIQQSNAPLLLSSDRKDNDIRRKT